MEPCAGDLTDECQLVIVKSKVLKLVILAFRGNFAADQISAGQGDDGLTDLMAWPGNVTLGKVNKLFFYASQFLWEENHFPSYFNRFKGYHFAFTGHSIGGAIASLTALKARFLGLVDADAISLYTFGEPRSGDSVLAETFNKYIPNNYRIVHSSGRCQGSWNEKIFVKL